MNSKAYWIWLSEILGAGAGCTEILSAFPDARSIYNASDAQRRLSGVFSPRQLQKLASTEIGNAGVNLDICEKNSWHCITYDDELYPPLLKRISNPPLVLYVWGSPEVMAKGLCFGIVGTRNPTPDSIKIATTISAQLADAGATIVSGGALGIDSAAHEGALTAHGTTIAVLGCGLGTRYLMQSAALRNEISKNGAVISEFSPFAPASKSSFPIRNRIISGLSRGVLVVEAGEKSGSIITANCAFNQGRDVFAVPGNIITSAYAGANKLIRDGATAVCGADDIIEEYSELYPGMLKKQKKQIFETGKKTTVKKSDASLSDKEKSVYALFANEPVYPGDLSASTGIPLGEIMTILTNLELNDYVTGESGGRYKLV